MLSNLITIKIVVTGVFAYAKRKGYIDRNPWRKEDLEYTHLFRVKESNRQKR